MRARQRETDGHLHCAGLRPIAYGLNGDCLRQVYCYGNGVLVVVGGRESRSHPCRRVGDTSGAGEGGQVTCVQATEVCVMQRAEVVLGALRKRAERAPVVHRLYRHLFNPELYGDAGSGPGEVGDIIRLLRAESYHPGRAPGGHPRDVLVERALGRLLAAVFGLEEGRGIDEAQAKQALLAALRGMRPARWALVGDVGDSTGTWTEAAMRGVLGERVRDGRVLELCGRLFRAYGERSMPVRVCRELHLAAVDRLVRRLPGVAGYVRSGTSLIITSHARPEGLREALGGLLGPRLELLELSRAGPCFMGYQVVMGPGGFRLRVPAGRVRERLRGYVRGSRAIRRCDRLGMTVEAMIALYRAELIRVAGEYAGSDSGHRDLRRFRHFHLGSLLETLASKERSSVRAALTRYRVKREGRSTIGKQTLAGTVVYPVITQAGIVL